MRVTPVPFTASGFVIESGKEQQIAGLTVEGFTSVKIFNGTNNTGALVATVGAGTHVWHYEVWCRNGAFIEVAGTGRGTVWVA